MKLNLLFITLLLFGSSYSQISPIAGLSTITVFTHGLTTGAGGSTVSGAISSAGSSSGSTKNGTATASGGYS